MLNNIFKLNKQQEGAIKITMVILICQRREKFTVDAGAGCQKKGDAA